MIEPTITIGSLRIRVSPEALAGLSDHELARQVQAQLPVEARHRSVVDRLVKTIRHQSTADPRGAG